MMQITKHSPAQSKATSFIHLHRPARALVAALAIALILIVDPVLTLAPNDLVLGLLDEPAHLATVVVVLVALPRPCSLTFVAAALVGGSLIDLDHLPMLLFDSDFWTLGTARPYSHSLAFVALLLMIAAMGGRIATVSGGAALGLAAHLLRDASTAPLALWWPMSVSSVSVPSTAYYLVLGLCLLATLRAWPGPASGPGRSSLGGRVVADHTP